MASTIHPFEQSQTATPRSSFTYHESNAESSKDGGKMAKGMEGVSRTTSQLAEEIALDEELITRYGADDPREPPAVRAPTPPPPPAPTKAEPDRNMVNWDGPNDPTNPQNWSFGYKCFTTGIGMVLCLNV